jgi:hypothetical protein
MMPGQSGMAVKAMIYFNEPAGLVYETAPIEGLATPSRGSRVTLHRSIDLPRPFWSRAHRLKKCTILMEIEPERIERARIQMCTWDGAHGEVSFTLNGHPLEIAGKGNHKTLYHDLTIQPEWLRRGVNTFELDVATAHHGIEILRPGPVLTIRSN